MSAAVVVRGWGGSKPLPAHVKCRDATRAAEEGKLLQKAVDESLNRGQDGKISASSAQLIELAETTTDLQKWQIQWSNADVKDRVLACHASQEYDNSRPYRIESKDGDDREAKDDWIHDRVSWYTNYLNRRGDAETHRKVLPTSRTYASSNMDWEAAISAKLLFAAFPNLNPNEPIEGALHSCN